MPERPPMGALRLTLPLKLIIAFGVVCAITLFQALAVWRNVSVIDSNLQRITDKLIPQNERVGALTVIILRASLETRHAMLMLNANKRKATIGEIRQLQAQAQQLVQEVGLNITSEEGRARYSAIQVTQNAFWAAAQQVLPLVEQGHIDEAVNLLETSIIPARNRFLDAVNAQKEWQIKLLDDETTASLERSHSTEVQVAVMSAVTAALGLVLVVLFMRQDQLIVTSTRDELTGLLNRREFTRLAQAELARVARVPGPTSLVMVDADYFKRINDRHGHPVGDEVLQQLAKKLLAGVRTLDVVARMGGEEFVLLLPHTDAQGALALAEKLRTSLAQTPLQLRNGEDLWISASFGVSSLPQGQAGTLEAMYASADKALYAAKANGRNRVEFHHGQGL
ncbi:diguanylate cyclase [Rhodoferax aquaticus]|uniref:diguanylate cyclase n=1 Tax=Rhodoferax aquaticus TaxID=2527691 RepID=A0A515EV53_9BURK|nr:diguanylate cyclase [Rhodoferax aquaticus]QDL56560.1 diguanylate cyclase [Rhodoferax aquaticus]